jgi:hypothetical protein
VPAERVKLLRDAFQAATKDPQLANEARALFAGGLAPSSGERILEFIRQVKAMPGEVRERATRYVAAD